MNFELALIRRGGWAFGIVCLPASPYFTRRIRRSQVVSFTGFNLNVYTGGTYLLPIFTIGKYHWQDEKVLLPLSVQFHHAVCDGYHADVLFNELQESAIGCKTWLAGK